LRRWDHRGSELLGSSKSGHHTRSKRLREKRGMEVMDNAKKRREILKRNHQKIGNEAFRTERRRNQKTKAARKKGKGGVGN